jgi:hypothetical protein
MINTRAYGKDSNGGRAEEVERGASRRGYLEHADGNSLVGAGDADEGLDRLPQRLRHGGRLLRRPRLRGDDEVGSQEESRSSGGAVRVNSSAVDLWCFLLALPSRGPWEWAGPGLNATDGENDARALASSGHMGARVAPRCRGACT